MNEMKYLSQWQCLIIHDKIQMEKVRKSFVEYDRTLSNEEIDLDILPKMSRDFYVEEC